MPKVTHKGIPSVPIPHLYCITRFSLHLGVLWDKGVVLGASCQEVWFIKGLNGQGVPRGSVSQLQCWQPQKDTHTHTHTPCGLGPALGLALQFSYDFRRGHSLRFPTIHFPDVSPCLPLSPSFCQVIFLFTFFQFHITKKNHPPKFRLS